MLKIEAPAPVCSRNRNNRVIPPLLDGPHEICQQVGYFHRHRATLAADGAVTTDYTSLFARDDSYDVVNIQGYRFFVFRFNFDKHNVEWQIE